MKILGIITARGGSKGISGKNLRKIAGVPMIQYTIDSAKNSKINKIVISTDDKKIAKFAESQGIEVPFLRPKSLDGEPVAGFVLELILLSGEWSSHSFDDFQGAHQGSI